MYFLFYSYIRYIYCYSLLVAPAGLATHRNVVILPWYGSRVRSYRTATLNSLCNGAIPLHHASKRLGINSVWRI